MKTLFALIIALGALGACTSLCRSDCDCTEIGAGGGKKCMGEWLCESGFCSYTCRPGCLVGEDGGVSEGCPSGQSCRTNNPAANDGTCTSKQACQASDAASGSTTGANTPDGN